MVDSDDQTMARIKKAIKILSNPKVYQQIMLASSPEAAKKIVESLPAVEELVKIGPKAGEVLLNLLHNPETIKNRYLVTIVLCLLLEIPGPPSTRILSRGIVRQNFRGINSDLAAELFLKDLGVDVDEDDRVSVATREAEIMEGPNQKGS